MRRLVASALWLLLFCCAIAGQQLPRPVEGFLSSSLEQSGPETGLPALGQNETKQAPIAPNQPQDSTNPAAQNQNDLLLTWGDVEKRIWATATPYLDKGFPELEQQIPELAGLEPAANQDALPKILHGVGEECVELLHRTPNIHADEEIETHRAYVPSSKQHVGYLMVVKQTANGISLDEYRTDKNGSPVAYAGAGQGFASMWTHFFPANQGQSRFRYLGEQKIDSRETMVAAFAQIPDKVKFPATFVVQGARISILYQGIAWIDPSDWKILRVREDLLAPRPDAKLYKFTARVRFGAVTVKKAAAELWLPHEADLQWDLAGQLGNERHVYSNYRLYVAKSRIILTP
jgi:hypothetical protein